MFFKEKKVGKKLLYCMFMNLKQIYIVSFGIDSKHEIMNWNKCDVN